MLYWLQTNFFYFLCLIGLFSLIVGSFLNVVIYRLPIIIKQQWHQQCHDFLEMQDSEKTPEKLNLVWPRSHCPHCKNTLKFYHNLPIISFIFLRGRCAFCHETISWQYPIVEILTTVLALIIAFQLALSLQTFALILLMYALVCLTFIDLQSQLLPDTITVLFLWIGLFLNCFNLFTNLASAVMGAIFGYLSLWLINFIFKLLRKIEGIGHGDFKLFALFGAWFGWQMLPLILLISASLSTVVSLILLIVKKIHRDTPLSFGPYLSLAGFTVALWGSQLIKLIGI